MTDLRIKRGNEELRFSSSAVDGMEVQGITGEGGGKQREVRGGALGCSNGG